MLRIILVLSFLITGSFAFSQSISGSWYGKADVIVQGVYNNYLTELVLKQRGDEIEGVFGYYFKDSYQSFFVRGTYNKETRAVSIKNLPMLFYQSRSTRGLTRSRSQTHSPHLQRRLGQPVMNPINSHPGYLLFCISI